MSKWTVDPEDFIKVIQSDLSSKVNSLAYAIFDEVVNRTPVWTGRLRANWRLSAGKVDTTYDPVRGSVSNPLPPPSRSILPKGNVSPTYISNFTPYSEIIEYGGSTQKPEGIVRVTLASMRFK